MTDLVLLDVPWPVKFESPYSAVAKNYIVVNFQQLIDAVNSLATGTGDMVAARNLADLLDMIVARDNLDVYSREETEAAATDIANAIAALRLAAADAVTGEDVPQGDERGPATVDVLGMQYGTLVRVNLAAAMGYVELSRYDINNEEGPPGVEGQWGIDSVGRFCIWDDTAHWNSLLPSVALQAFLASYAPLASPALTGNPQAPTFLITGKIGVGDELNNRCIGVRTGPPTTGINQPGDWYWDLSITPPTIMFTEAGGPALSTVWGGAGDAAAAFAAFSSAHRLHRHAGAPVSAGPFVIGADDLVPVDMSLGAWTATLPNAPAGGSSCLVKTVVGGATLTVVTHADPAASGGVVGVDTLNIEGGPTTTTVVQGGEWAWFFYDPSTHVWTKLAGNSVANMDTRYRPLNPAVVQIVSSATWAPTINACDLFIVTAQAVAVTAIANPTGTPSEGQPFRMRVHDNGTARALTWSGSQWRAGAAVPLPTTTVPGVTIDMEFHWNAVDGKWDLFILRNI